MNSIIQARLNTYLAEETDQARALDFQHRYRNYVRWSLENFRDNSPLILTRSEFKQALNY